MSTDLASLIAATARRPADTASRRPVPAAPAGGGQPAVAGVGPTEPGRAVRADPLHDIRDLTILGRMDLLDYGEVIQELSGESVVADPARGQVVVWNLPGLSGSLSVASRPAVPAAQVPSGLTARRRAWSLTVFIVHQASGAKTLSLPGGLGAVPADAEQIQFSTTAGKIDVITCTYVEGINRWFSFVGGLGY